MMRGDHYLFYQLFVPFALCFFLVFGMLALLVGLGLLLFGSRMHPLFAAMNRWTTGTRAYKWMDVVWDTEGAASRHRRALGILCLAGAAFSIFVLTTGFDAARLADSLGSHSPHVLVLWLEEAAWWLLIVGNGLALAVGVMLLFFPKAAAAVEALAGRWYSVQRQFERGDAMHLTLDQWVESAPKLAGAIISLGALVVVIQFALLAAAR